MSHKNVVFIHRTMYFHTKIETLVSSHVKLSCYVAALFICSENTNLSGG
jgi:hypothetical protein